MVKTCILDIGDEEAALSWDPWCLIDSDDGRYPDNGTSGGNLPNPTYPNGETDGTFTTGDCAKGWIFFDTDDADIVHVQYENQSGDQIIWGV